MPHANLIYTHNSFVQNTLRSNASIGRRCHMPLKEDTCDQKWTQSNPTGRTTTHFEVAENCLHPSSARPQSQDGVTLSRKHGCDTQPQSCSKPFLQRAISCQSSIAVTVAGPESIKKILLRDEDAVKATPQESTSFATNWNQNHAP